MPNYDPPLNVSILVTSSVQLAAVYALLGNTSPVALVRGPSTVEIPVASQSLVTGAASPVSSAVSTEPSASNVEPAPNDAGPVDAAGWPWSPELHASTRTLTTAGLWRMRIGVSRPNPKPGFPKDAIGTVTSGSASPPTAAATTLPAGEDEDEFAAFRAAADKANAGDAAAAASVPARKWTDADIGALCNQAAVKLGDPAPIKELIADFVPIGEIAHSRKIPPEERENFAQALELKAGIVFAG